MSSTDKQTWYEVKRYIFGDSSWVVPIVVIKETEKTVTIEDEKGYQRRRNKDNDLWPTKFEAEAEVTRTLTEKIRQAQEKLDSAKAVFQKWFLRA